MKKITSNFYASSAVFAIGMVSLVAFGFQHAQAAFKKGVASGESIRVTEANSCNTAGEENTDTLHFSGCNSIL